MSLINDALKRAKQAQKNTPPPPGSGPQLRPAESAQRPKGDGLSLVLPASIFLAVVLMVLFVWRSSHKNEALATTPVSQSDVVAGKASVPASPANVAAPAAVSQPVSAASAPAGTAAPSTAANQTAGANVPVAAAPPAPAPPKLQAIFFDPARPSAIVSGKTVVVGGRVREFRVAAINQQSVTLVSATLTNVLSLEE